MVSKPALVSAAKRLLEMKFVSLAGACVDGGATGTLPTMLGCTGCAAGAGACTLCITSCTALVAGKGIGLETSFGFWCVLLYTIITLGPYTVATAISICDAAS